MPYRFARKRRGPLRKAARWGLARLYAALGGPARAEVIVILACVLALDAADKGTIGALAPELEQDLHVGNTEIGALVATSSGVGALAAVPVGMLTDRVNRVRLLAGSIVLWSAAMVAGALAGSFSTLLMSRVALGAVTATAGPTLASLIGDYFPVAERGRVYGFILAGETLGAGFGLILVGDLGDLLSWRWSFGLLALIALALLFVVVRRLREPARGGRDRMPALGGRHGVRPQPEATARRQIRRRGVAPDPALVLREDPTTMSLRAAVIYVLRIPTNRLMIIASVVGYFFFAGLRTFAVEFVSDHFGLTKIQVSGLLPLVGAGALLGVLTGGRLADRLVRRGHVEARVGVPATAYLVSAVLFLPALVTTSTEKALPLFTAAAFCLAAANPPLDAARLDVVHHRLWGRAESVRTALRMSAEAGAPVIFGMLADSLSHGGRADGLEYTFLLMLIPLAANGAILLWARRSYPEDVAAAVVSEENTRLRGPASGGARGRP
ncbi:MFS transporter [Sphaerisporangium krabiense]|uniref:Putative MFS family arabinose efflux permease n=1 Tax=Sphaerisporangium krabiense TaxID=763782 RepID=A0A7W9DSS2_9ACTN|nr:MFS transporter [Sphaerisporangium krabiense]MBB5629873.1 putative MFS family arabinose efflux permease [Sphaerisporangium krabiense]GII63974.1 MFS transporter [Sphaerisporangium krabiense]